MQILQAAVTAAVFYIVVATARSIFRRRRHARLARELGCGNVTIVPSWDPIFGLDQFIETVRATNSDTFLKLIHKRHEQYGTTYTLDFLGMHWLATLEPQNVQAVLATQFKEFELGVQRFKAFAPLLGKGIFNADGEIWEHSRALVRPNFARHQVADLSTFETQVDKMLKLIPTDGNTVVDLQDLFFRLTLDAATDFLFGEAANSLDNPENEFARAFNYSQFILGERYRMGDFVGLHRNKEFTKACKVVHDFTDRYVAKALAEHAAIEKSGGLEKEDPNQPYVFSRELAKSTTDPIILRDQLVNILLAGRDTTAGMLSNLFFVVSRRPDIWRKLKAEVATLGDRKPTFENMKDLKYVRNVINETLRLYPSVPLNVRQAIKDTTLPTGGGPLGTDPVFCPKGTIVWWTVFEMHRREDLFGADAKSFNPNRWDTHRPGWEYLPFNGGPRICLGQQFALTEAAYTIIRMVQSFDSISAVPGQEDEEWIESVTLTLASKQGARVVIRGKQE